MSTAVRPLGTDCSAHTTPPLPTANMKKPSTASRPHALRAGSDRPRALSTAASTRPAVAYRSPPMRNGGIVSSAILMAKYVVPQTRQTVTQATHARLVTAADGEEPGVTTSGASAGPAPDAG